MITNMSDVKANMALTKNRKSKPVNPLKRGKLMLKTNTRREQEYVMQTLS